MPIDSLCARWNQPPPATRSFATAMAGVSGSSSTWIVPVSAASRGAKYFGESFIARSSWYVSCAMAFLPLLLPLALQLPILGTSEPMGHHDSEIMNDRGIDRDDA